MILPAFVDFLQEQHAVEGIRSNNIKAKIWIQLYKKTTWTQ